MVLQYHILCNTKRNTLLILLPRRLPPHQSFHRHIRLALIKRPARKNTLPPLPTGLFHVPHTLGRGDGCHAGLRSAPDVLIEGEEEGVVVLAGFVGGWEEGEEEGEEVGFAGSGGTC